MSIEAGFWAHPIVMQPPAPSWAAHGGCRLGVGNIMPAHQRWWSGRALSELTKIAITDAVAMTVISRIKDLRHHASI